jgi:type IV secretory pathway TraG/TraD family ATPase VirD4
VVELVAGVIALLVFFAAVVCVAYWTLRAARWFEAGEVFEPVYPSNIDPLRGRDLTTQSRVQAAHRNALVSGQLPGDFRGIFWGGEYWPLELANLHFFLQGATGSGKSVSLAQTVDSLLPLLGQGLGNRLVIFDPKREWPGRLYTRLSATVPVHMLNPFELRGSRWDLAKDIRTRAEALMLAFMLVPEEKADQNKYFRDAARAVLFALVAVLMHYAPGRWTLRHLIVLARLRPRLVAVLKLLPETSDVAGQFLHQNKSGREVVATIGSSLESFSVVAACWDRARTGVSFSEFLRSEAALVLGFDESVSAAMAGVYRLMVKLLADRVMLNDDPEDRTFFVFDEFKLFGRSDDLINVAIRGRSSGACLFIASQDINAIDALYGRETARELIGNLHSKAFLRVESEAAATFAAECIGSHEVLQYTQSRTFGQQASRTVSESVVKRQLVLPDEVRNLPLADPATDAVDAYVLTPLTDPFLARYPFVGALRACAPPLGFKPYLRRPPGHQHLRPFGPDDLVELNLPAKPALLKTIHPELFSA